MSRLLAELNHRDEGRIDPWDYLDPSMVPAGPVRVIAVTPQLRELDAADRAARELRDRPTWTPRYADPARVYRRPVDSRGPRDAADAALAARRDLEHRAARAERSRQDALKPLLLCANGCGTSVTGQGKTGMCLDCVNAKGTRRMNGRATPPPMAQKEHPWALGARRGPFEDAVVRVEGTVS